MKMRVKLQRGYPVITSKNNEFQSLYILINFDLWYLTLNYTFNIFFNIHSLQNIFLRKLTTHIIIYERST